MPPRSNWKGYLKLSLVSCPVALFSAASATEVMASGARPKNTTKHTMERGTAILTQKAIGVRHSAADLGLNRKARL